MQMKAITTQLLPSKFAKTLNILAGKAYLVLIHTGYYKWQVLQEKQFGNIFPDHKYGYDLNH